MPYCPSCKYEYKEGATICPDCGVALVKGELVYPQSNPERDLESVLLFRTDNYIEAQFLAGYLEEEDIPYVTKRLGYADSQGGKGGGEMTPGALTGVGPAEIYVNPLDYERAKAVLDSLEENKNRALEEDEKIDDTEES
jgi:hypothetical protein